MAVVGGDLAAEVAARCLAAAGVGGLRLSSPGGRPPPAVTAALAASNPDVRVEVRRWPDGGAAWLELIRGAAVVVRAGFDDDAMLRAAVRLGVPAVVTRALPGRVDVLSFRRHGPCTHGPLEVPARPVTVSGVDGAAAVVAGTVAAAEVLAIVTGLAGGGTRARLLGIPLDGGGGGDGDGGGGAAGAGLPRAADIPWAPECFACGGAGTEMSFP